MEEEGDAHATLALLPSVMEGDGALPLPVLPPVLKLKKTHSPLRTTVASILVSIKNQYLEAFVSPS